MSCSVVLLVVIDVPLEIVHFPNWDLSGAGLWGYFRLVTDGFISIVDFIHGFKLFGNFSLLHFLVLISVLELVISSIFVIYDLGGDSQSFTDNVTYDTDTGEVIKQTRTNHITHKPRSSRVGFRRR